MIALAWLFYTLIDLIGGTFSGGRNVPVVLSMSSPFLLLRAVYLAQPTADGTTGYVGLRAFGKSALNVELWGYFNLANFEEHAAARHRLIGNIVELARKLEVEVAYPTRTIRVVSEGTGFGLEAQKSVEFD